MELGSAEKSLSAAILVDHVASASNARRLKIVGLPSVFRNVLPEVGNAFRVLPVAASCSVGRPLFTSTRFADNHQDVANLTEYAHLNAGAVES